MAKRATKTKERRCDPALTGRPAEPGSKLRRSRATFWRVIVLVGLHVVFGLHVWHLYATGRTISPLEPSEATQLAEHSIINAGLIFFALTIGATLIFGRFFCGWGCHLLALQDLSLALLRKLGIKPNPLRSRALMIVPFLAALYMFAWPAAYRLWTGKGEEFQGVELTTSDFWETFPHPAVAIATFVVCGFVIVYFMGAKGFCTYACPYGAIFAAADKVAPGKIRVDEKCDGCGHCTIACTSNVAVAQEVRDWGMVKDTGCMKCLDCVSVCPTGALSFGFGTKALGAKPRKEPRPAKARQLPVEELLLTVFFAAAFFAVRGLWVMDLERMPFLFALGVAGVVAVCGLVVVRLFTRPDVRLQQWTLKKDGTRTAAGHAALALALPIGALWVHTGLVRFHEHRAEVLTESLESTKHGWFDRVRKDPPPDFEARVRELDAHARWLERWAIVAGAPNARRLTWTSVWLGHDEEAIERASAALENGLGSIDEALLVAEVTLARGDRAAAAEQFAAIHERRPDLIQVTAKLAPLLIEVGQPARALAALDAGLEHHPDHLLMLLQRASIAMVLGQIDSVEATLLHAIDVAPDAPEPRRMLEQFRREVD